MRKRKVQSTRSCCWLHTSHVSVFRVGTRPAMRRHPAGFRSYNHPPSPLRHLCVSLLFQNSLFIIPCFFLLSFPEHDTGSKIQLWTKSPYKAAQSTDTFGSASSNTHAAGPVGHYMKESKTRGVLSVVPPVGSGTLVRPPWSSRSTPTHPNHITVHTHLQPAPSQPNIRHCHHHCSVARCVLSGGSAGDLHQNAPPQHFFFFG